MKKSIYLVASMLLLTSGALFAQGEMDVYKYSQKDISGTARYLGMSGAFGALGGDISSMTSNPGGLAIYRSSEVVTTLSLSSIKSNSNWNGSNQDASKTKFSFDNIAYVGYFPTGKDVGVKSWNIGFAYKRVKNFNRNYRIAGRQNYSVADYAAYRATNAYQDKDGWYGINIDKLRPLQSDNIETVNKGYANLPGQWMPALGFGAGFFDLMYAGDTDVYYSTFGDWKTDDKGNEIWNVYSPDAMNLSVNEKGAIDTYDFSFSTNISDLLFLGATVSVTDLNYSMKTTYDEFFNGVGDLYLDNGLTTDGTGYSFNIGAIVRPVDFLRLGVAYNSSTWYKMTDYFFGEAGSHIEGYGENSKMNATTPNDALGYDYKMRSPDRWIFSAAAILGQMALISVDYELTNYQNSRLYDSQGYAFESDNDLIRQDFGSGGLLKVGAEVKVTPQFSVRAGGAWSSSPVKVDANTQEIFTAGTIPNFTIDKGYDSYSVGLGYRFTPSFYVDLACVYKTHKEDAYLFANTYNTPGTIGGVESDAISLKTKTTQVALTFGYKF